jgi:solute carrier family 25 protein 33/36
MLQIWRQEGVKGFGRGLSASYLGVSESTLQWVLYERLKRVFREGDAPPTTYREKLRDALGAGFFAKLTATVITYPHEVPSPHPTRRERGLTDCGRLLELDYGRLRH